MDALIKVLPILADGGTGAIIVILAALIAGLLYDRKRLIDELRKKDDKIDKIIDDYFKGNLTLSEALNNLRIVLHEIKAKL